MMKAEHDWNYFTGSSFSDLFAKDITNARHAFLLQYPCTASWAFYPNTKKFYIQDGSREEVKVGYDKICQKEPWKNMAVLGDAIPGILVRSPRDVLVDYWREHFGFTYNNMVVLERSVWCDYLNQSGEYQKFLSLFPYDGILPEKHAVDPEAHYRLLGKTMLSEISANCPRYQTYNLLETPLDQIELPNEYPYLIKATHGLSGEGTYIIRRVHDVEFCFSELRHYLRSNLVTEIIVSEFVKNEVANYCVQFYVNKAGEPTLIGATSQLVSPQGEFLGGLIHYEEMDITRFSHEIASASRFLHQNGYFGVVGLDVLEDRDGQFHVIDANIRVNGSTPLCLQRHRLLALGKETAKYSGGYRMDGTLDDVLVTLRPWLDRKDFIILSALEKAKYGKIYCEIYGVVAGESLNEMQRIEARLMQEGLHLSESE